MILTGRHPRIAAKNRNANDAGGMGHLVDL